MIPRPEDLIRVLPETVWCIFGVLLMLRFLRQPQGDVV